MRNLSFNRRRSNPFVWTALAFLVCALAVPALGLAEETAPAHPEATTGADHADATDLGPKPAIVELNPEITALYDKYGAYCAAIVDPAREHRYALKRAEIEKLIADLELRVAEAEAKSDVLEKWVKRREEFARQANEKVVEIYANMRPEASAARLEQLDINLAASLLLAIPPRQASPILNEMDEKNAALITSVMAASARKDDPS